jgi:L-ascorbate metabolism protein UlaG (beta-lactamase superfamily)
LDRDVTLLANAGILLRFGATKLLIDGIHQNALGPFDGLSAGVLADLLEGVNPSFRDIDYLLFTHCHGDHFSAGLVEEYLRRYSVKGVMMPDRQTWPYPSLREIVGLRADRHWWLALPLEKRMDAQLTDELTVTVFCSIHAGEEYRDIENFCYLLRYRGCNVLVMGDSEYNPLYFSKTLAGERIDVLFVNPLFLCLLSGRKVIKALNPGRVIVYHLPFEDKDGMIGMRKRAANDAEQYKETLPPIELLGNELQKIAF